MIRLPSPGLPDPRILLRLAARPVPFFIQRSLVEQLLNRAFAGPLSDDAFELLEDHIVGLDVRDLGLQLRLGYDKRRLVLHNEATAVDTWIRGSSTDFLSLARRREDPDTLFFQRRLLIEGDTELGLGLKNLLDSIDWSDLPKGFQWGLTLADRLNPAAT